MAPALFKQDSVSRSEDRERPPPPAAVRSADRPGRGRGAAEAASVSVLGPGLTIVGDVKGHGTVQLEGRVEGTLVVEGQLTIAGRGSVRGNVTADQVVVGGEVEGTLVARETAKLKSGCRVTADVQALRLELEEGGTLNGRVEMKGAAGQARQRGAGSSSKDEEREKASDAA